jgi:hypothetical protein
MNSLNGRALRRAGVLAGALLVLAGCDSTSAHVHSAPELYRFVSAAPTPEAQKFAPVIIGRETPDLAKLDWYSVALPGVLCGISQSFHLARGHESVFLSDEYGVVYVDAPGRALTGRLGKGIAVSAQPVSCENGGETADGVFQYSYLVAENLDGHLWLVGVIIPQDRPIGVDASLLKIGFKGGIIVADESWYRASDSTCCPTGRALTDWSLVGGQMVHSATEIVS